MMRPFFYGYVFDRLRLMSVFIGRRLPFFRWPMAERKR